ncbi:hypothetical protein D3C87_1406730 [compost metagenome]
MGISAGSGAVTRIQGVDGGAHKSRSCPQGRTPEKQPAIMFTPFPQAEGALSHGFQQGSNPRDNSVLEDLSTCSPQAGYPHDPGNEAGAADHAGSAPWVFHRLRGRSPGSSPPIPLLIPRVLHSRPQVVHSSLLHLSTPWGEVVHTTAEGSG